MIRKRLSVLGMVLIAIGCGKAPQSQLPTVIVTQTPDNAFFPVGFMGPADEEMFSRVAAGGFNVVYEFRSVQEIDEAEDYLNRAEAVGLYVIQNMPSCRAYESHDPVCEKWNAHVWSEAEWGDFISTMAVHDNLVAWYLPDEIGDYSAAANLYEWVHRYDPRGRPVFGNPGTYQQSIVNLFPAFTDFLWATGCPDHREEPRALVTYAMKIDANACRGMDTRWGAILQFFDSAEFGGSGGYPTAHELRCDSYQAIIGGGTGLWYFNYEMGRDLPGLWEAVVTIADEIVGSGRLNEVILSPDVPQTITKTILSGPIQSPPVQGEVYDSIQMLEKAHGGTYLFAVNIATDSVLVEFGNLPVGTEAVQVLFEERRIPVSNGSFRDSFVQDDVHIYRMISSAVFLPLVMKLSW
jgi:hypothetical protein